MARKLDFFKRLDLSQTGEGWEGCFIDFRSITAPEAKSFIHFKELDQDNQDEVEKRFDEMIALLKEKFVRGKVVAEGSLVEMEVEDIDALPNSVILKSITLLSGDGMSEKKET